MAEAKENKERIAFLKKKNEARKKASTLDWSKDKALSYNGKLGYKYLSIDKMKRNLLPVFMDVGLDFKTEYETVTKQDAIGQMAQHWIVECVITLTDVDTGYFETTRVFGEAGDSGDKAIAKAGTYALKTWLADTFMLIDGVDPDQGSDTIGSRAFTPKTDKEQEEVKSKVFEQAVPVPAKPAKPAVPAVKNVAGTMKDSGDPTEKKEAPVPKPEPAKATTEKKVEIPPVPKPKMPERKMTPAEEAVEKLKVEKLSNFEPTEPQKRAFDRIFRYYGVLGQKGEITDEFAEQLAKDRSNIGNNTEAVAFIRKYEVPDDFTE